MKLHFKVINQKGHVPIVALLVLIILGILFSKILNNIIFDSKVPVSSQANPLISAPIQETTKLSKVDEQNRIEKYLTVEAALLGVADSSSLFYQDLSNNAQFSIEPTKSWIPASTIKAFVVLEAFKQRDLGLINFDQRVTISSDNVVPTELETEEFPKLREGTSATIRQLVEAMVIQSDNTAYNTLLDVLDRRSIDLTLRNIGITETVVGEKLNLDDSQFQRDLQVPGRQPNTTTVKDLATFFDLLYNHKIADADEILSIFKRQEINNMLPALLPPDTIIAHKTGDWAPIYHDGGIIYRPSNPFVLTIFTNSGDPSIVSKLARVAYYQTPESVGVFNSSTNQTPQSQASPYETVVLSSPSKQTQVLGITTPADQNFPTITAQDLGINTLDLTISPKSVSDFNGAWVTPGSLFYPIKIFFEQKQLELSRSNQDKVLENLSLAKDRLAEVKTLLNRGDLTGVDSLLDESESYLSKATQLAQKDTNKDYLLVQIRQVDDLHFAVLNQESRKIISGKEKEKFIDDIYNFYQKNNNQVMPVVKTSVLANPLQQKPAIGTVTSIQNNVATMQFDDGSKREILLSDSTKVREFQQSDYQPPNTIGVGDKIAIVGLTNQDSQIIPEFILKNVPKELPSQHRGTVIEINPSRNTIKILNQSGQQEIITVDQNTKIKARDTAVSLEGITVGSIITVFGTKSNIASQNTSATVIGTLQPYPLSNLSSSPKSSPTLLPSPSPSNSNLLPEHGSTSTTSSHSEQQAVNGNNPSSPSGPSSSTSNSQTPIELHATSVTVNVNGSGKNEVTKPQSKSTPAPESKPTGSRKK